MAECPLFQGCNYCMQSSNQAYQSYIHKYNPRAYTLESNSRLYTLESDLHSHWLCEIVKLWSQNYRYGLEIFGLEIFPGHFLTHIEYFVSVFQYWNVMILKNANEIFNMSGNVLVEYFQSEYFQSILFGPIHLDTCNTCNAFQIFKKKRAEDSMWEASLRWMPWPFLENQ